MIAGLQKQIELLRKENAALKEQKKLSAKNHFGSKSQKLSSKNHDLNSCEVDKDDFDGSFTPDHLWGRNRDEIPTLICVDDTETA